MTTRSRFSILATCVALLMGLSPAAAVASSGPDAGTCLNYTDYMHATANLPFAANYMTRAGDFLYLSSHQIIDVSVTGQPQVAGTFPAQTGQVRGLTATDANLFVIYSAADGAGFNGLAIYDRSHQTAPTLLSTLAMPAFMTQLRVVGDRAYLRNDEGLMLIVDISDPSAPSAHGAIGQGWLDSFDLRGQWLYAVDRVRHDVVVIDVTDMDNIQVDYRLDLPDVISITFAQGYGYFLHDGGGTSMLAFSAPEVYTVVHDLPDLTRPLVVHGELGYTFGNPLEIRQLAAPAAPTLVATVPFVVHSGLLDGDRALLGISNSFAELDLSNTEDLPGVTAALDLEADLSAMIPAGDHLITLSWQGLTTYDVTDCTMPTRLGGIMWQDRLLGQALAGDYLYVLSEGMSAGSTVLKVFDVTDMSAPQEVASKTLTGFLAGLTAVGDFLYAADHGALVIINVGDPLNPAMFSRTEGVGFSPLTAVSGHDMIVADGTMLRHFDVTSAAGPSLLTSVDTGVEGRQVLLSGNVAYYAHRGGVKLYEVTTSGAKNILADITVPGISDGIAFDAGTLYVEGNGIYMLDVSDLMQPVFVGNLGYVAERAAHLSVIGDCLYFDQYLSGDRGRLNIAHRHCQEQGPVAPMVVIDIKPGSDRNRINCRREHGVIPVAILTTDDFDALSVDHTTVRFGPGEASEVHRRRGHGHHRTGTLKRHERDVDGDGDLDLVFHFAAGEADIACGDTEAWLTGETFDGVSFAASDKVRTHRGRHDCDGDDDDDDDDDDNDGHDGDKLRAGLPTLSLAPNPFNPQTTIAFNVPQAVRLRVEIYDLTGRRVALVADEVFGAGGNRVVWRGADSSGRPAASGVYFVRVTGPGVELKQRALLLK